MKVMGAPSRMVRIALTVSGLAAILVVGALDHWTGPEISFSLFYLVPIAGAAWFAGRRAGILISICAGATWLAADLIPSHYSHPAIAYWNAMVRLVVFLAVSLLLSRVREMNLSLERKARERAVALAAEKDGHEVTRDALRDSEERFRRLIESVKDYAIFMLDPSGHVMTWNEGARRLTGYEPQEILGRHYSVLLPPDQADCRGAAEYLRTALTDGTYEGEGLRVRKDGRRFWAVTVLTPLRDKQGALQGFSKVVHDITARKQLENELLATEERERRRIGRDLHDVLGQDLTGIAFLSKELEEALAAKGFGEAAEAERIAGYANQAIHRARGLAKGLCPVELRSDGLMTGLEQLASRLRDMFGVECSFECEQPVLVHDEAAALHLYRIAQEAAGNAIRHGRARRVRILLAAADGQTVLRVEDDGCGIPEEPTESGGMGIAVMNYRAGAIGGALRIARRPAGGTEVVCSVPTPGGPLAAEEGQDSP